MEFPRAMVEEQHPADTNDRIELGNNSEAAVTTGELRTAKYRVVESPVEAKPLAREEVTWQKVRAGDVRNVIFHAEDEAIVEEKVIDLMDNEAGMFASTKTGEITLPATKGLSDVEQKAVLARALIEDVRETERRSEQQTIEELREELRLVYAKVQELEGVESALTSALGRVEQYQALVTPDMITQAQIITDLEQRNQALQTQNEVLSRRAERPARAARLDAGFIKTAIHGMSLRGNF